MVWLRRGIYSSVLLALGCSLLGYASSLYPLLDIVTHFKVQYFVLGLIGFFYFLSQGRPRWIGLSLICMMLNLMAIAPWYFPAKTSFSQPIDTLKVLSLNVNVSNTNYAPTLSLIRAEAPDLISLMEVNQGWLQALESIKPLYPYALRSPQAESCGIIILSKFPIQSVPLEPQQKVQQEVQQKVQQKVQQNQSYFLIGALQIGDRTIQTIALHPPPPKNLELVQRRNQTLEQLGKIIRESRSPTLVMGDFNTTMWSPIYQRFVADARLNNTRQGFGILPTWHAFIPPLLIPIDHCLVSENFKVKQMRVGPNVNSDHLPILIDLGY